MFLFQRINMVTLQIFFSLATRPILSLLWNGPYLSYLIITPSTLPLTSLPSLDLLSSKNLFVPLGRLMSTNFLMIFLTLSFILLAHRHLIPTFNYLLLHYLPSLTNMHLKNQFPITKTQTLHLRTRGHQFNLPICIYNLHKNSFVPRCLFKFI